MTTWLNFPIVIARQEAKECESSVAWLWPRRKGKKSLGVGGMLQGESEMKELLVQNIVLMTGSFKGYIWLELHLNYQNQL